MEPVAFLLATLDKNYSQRSFKEPRLEQTNCQ